MNTEVLGFIAGSLVAVSLVPQIIKSVKTKSTGDISLQWNLINLGGQVLWIVYGITIKSIALYSMSTITLVMALTMLGLKFRYGMAQQHSASIESNSARTL